jgi:hypothetical protein
MAKNSNNDIGPDIADVTDENFVPNLIHDFEQYEDVLRRKIQECSVTIEVAEDEMLRISAARKALSQG